MGAFDLKFAAYERSMQQNDYFGLKGKAIGEQLGRYAEALQYEETKAANKAAGREFGRQMAEERRALSASEQNSLSSRLNGGQNVSNPASVIAENNPVIADNEIKVAQKMKVGTKKTGFKFYLMDEQGQVYQVDKKAYNAAQKGKITSKEGLTLLDSKKDKVPEKIKKAAQKLKAKNIETPKHNYNIITDPQAYRQQKADMYEKLWGNFSHPSNTPLGTAEVKPTGERKTWTKYFQERGKVYPQPVSGVAEADRRAASIIKGNEVKQQVEEALKPKTEFNPTNIEKWSGHSENKVLDAMNDYYRKLEKQPTIQTVTDSSDDLKSTVASQKEKINELGQKVVKQTDKIDDLSKTVVKQSDEIADLTRKLSKTNKKVAVIATIVAAAAGAVGYFLGKSDSESGEGAQTTEASTGTATRTGTETETGNTAGTPTPTATTTATATATETGTGTETETETEVPREVADSLKITSDNKITTSYRDKLPLDLNENGEYKTKKGDTFWDIAERYLKGVYAKEPEKFENLPKSKRDTMIQKECERIMKQNGYWYDKKHNLPEPMLYQNIKITVSRIDEAA